MVTPKDDARQRVFEVGQARRRGGERGAAVFVVVLVIAMLTGIGVFAARSSTVSVAATGHERQMTQTHYITEYAMLATAAELASLRKEAYIRTMAQSPDPNCISIPKDTTTSASLVSNSTCYRFGLRDLETQMQVGANEQLIVPTVAGAHGSLGPVPLEAGFLVEMTDLGPASPPVAGNDLTSSGAASVQYVAVTLNGVGQVRPQSTTPNLLEQVVASSASTESARAHIIVGPIPR